MEENEMIKWYINYTNSRGKDILIPKECTWKHRAKLIRKCINLSKARNSNITLVRPDKLKYYHLEELKEMLPEAEKDMEPDRPKEDYSEYKKIWEDSMKQLLEEN